jgi:hypothetical protein
MDAKQRQLHHQSKRYAGLALTLSQYVTGLEVEKFIFRPRYEYLWSVLLSCGPFSLNHLVYSQVGVPGFGILVTNIIAVSGSADFGTLYSRSRLYACIYLPV